MTREEKIQAIYEAMANKKRTFGCRCRRNDGEDVIFIRQNETWSYLSIRENEEFTVSLWYAPEIIWHPVMIWDVLNYCSSYISDWDDSVDSQIDLLSYWGDYRLPIEDQPEECIDFVHSQTLKS